MVRAGHRLGRRLFFQTRLDCFADQSRIVSVILGAVDFDVSFSEVERDPDDYVERGGQSDETAPFDAAAEVSATRDDFHLATGILDESRRIVETLLHFSPDWIHITRFGRASHNRLQLVDSNSIKR